MVIFSSSCKFRCLAAILAFWGSLAGGAQAATTEWAVNEGGRMRLVVLSAQTSGDIQAALQIEPASGWVTYWREPGDSGIPPQITILPGSNAAFESLSYPVPKRLDIGGAHDIGYDGPVTLPFGLKRVDKARPASFTAQVFIGLCKNICIPFQAEFSLTPHDAGQSDRPANALASPLANPQESAILMAAQASLPEGPSPDFTVTHFALSGDLKLLHLELALPATAKGPPEVFVTGPSGYVFTRLSNGQRQGPTFSADVAIGKLPSGYSVQGKRWGILVKSGNRAMETALAFE